MNTGMREPETAASSPNVDWKRARGRVVGCWLSVAGLILAVPFPFPAFIVGVLGLGLSARALNEIPKGAPAEHRRDSVGRRRHPLRRHPLPREVRRALNLAGAAHKSFKTLNLKERIAWLSPRSNPAPSTRRPGTLL